MIHTVQGFGVVNKAEVDVFLELSCFFNDTTDVDNLISGSSSFSTSSLNIWKFTVCVLLKPGLEDFEEDFWKTLESLWTAGRSNQSILKEISPKYSLGGLMLKLKFQYFGHLILRTLLACEMSAIVW